MTTTPHEAQVDGVDRSLLRLLAEDGRLSHREIARRVGMSPGAVSQRIERLERLGVIRGYHASIDTSRLGFRTAALIGLQVTQGGSAIDMMEQLSSIDEVTSVSMVTGSWDFMVELNLRDHGHLREVVLGDVWRLPIFRHSETMVVLEKVDRAGDWFLSDPD